jgi:dCMP deaminase
MLGKYKRFVPVALAYGALSKMPNTKVGCVILGASFQTLSEGWNGAPRGSNADVDGRLSDRATRLTWVCHAEANAIASAAMDGRSLKGSTLIVTLMPCMACAKSIVQAGIIRVLCPVPTDPRWAEDFNHARALFDECSVDLVYYDTIGERE